jgi:hypothetical protein
MKKQTAVEWLVAHFKEYGFDFSHHEREINQAKAMERERLKDAYQKGIGWNYQKIKASEQLIDFEQYYNETYGGDK